MSLITSGSPDAHVICSTGKFSSIQAEGFIFLPLTSMGSTRALTDAAAKSCGMNSFAVFWKCSEILRGIKTGLRLRQFFRFRIARSWPWPEINPLGVRRWPRAGGLVRLDATKFVVDDIFTSG